MKKDTVVTRNASKIVPFEKEREADLNAAIDFLIGNTDPVSPTKRNGTEPTIEFPAFVEKNEGESAQFKNSNFSLEQKKCPDLHVMWEKAKLGLSESCRTGEGNLERISGTKRGYEFRKLGVPLKFTLKIIQLSQPLSDSGRVQGILKNVKKALCAEKKKNGSSQHYLRYTLFHTKTEVSALQMGDGEGFHDPSNPNLRVEDFVEDKLTWNKGCENTFAGLTDRLISGLILFIPEFSRNLIVQMDYEN
ncbi:hypothetical protein TNCV_2051931 [Trichonephila clavipes]|nr:hypothetical protein TNCV_2051931 [Trichonephila clavipes]